MPSAILEKNVASGITKRHLKPAKSRIRYIEAHEYETLIDSAPDYLRPLIIFAANTGMRREEQLSLRWTQIDFENRQIHLITTKSGVPRDIPIPAPALAQISAQKKHINSPYVFTARDGRRYGVKKGQCSFRTAWRTTLRNAGIDDFRWHDLRHTFATWAIQGKHDWLDKAMPVERLRQWMGHSSIDQTMEYAHLNVDTLHEELTKAAAQNTAHEHRIIPGG